jgi:spore coat protein U-like protein
MRLRSRIVNGLICIVSVIATIACSTPAHAVLTCTFTITAVNFGNINLTANTVFTTTGTFTANCTGGTASSTARICPNINAGTGGTTTGNPRFMLNGATQLNYNLYSNAAHTTVWGSYLWGFAQTPPTINIALNGSGAGSATSTIFAQVSAGQQTLPTGTYTSSFSGTNTQIAYAQSTVGNCAAIGATNATAAPFTVTATYPATCAVSATTLNFGATGVLTAAVNGTSTLTATCSSPTPYNIGLNAGTATGATVTTRKMTFGAATVSYAIYSNAARTTNWGQTIGTDTVAGTGSGLAQNYTVYGQVPAQATPAPGTYTDTIIATVTY